MGASASVVVSVMLGRGWRLGRDIWEEEWDARERRGLLGDKREMRSKDARGVARRKIGLSRGNAGQL